MLLRFRSPFKVGEQEEDEEKQGSHGLSSAKRKSSSSSVAVGLRILVQISQGKSNVVVKSAAVRLTKPTTHNNNNNTDYCFLKTCCLCNIGLSLDKEVYMYRGDQGFCSIECRNRQIKVDEMRELEASTKQMIASYRRRNRCNTSSPSTTARHETRPLLEDRIHRHKKLIPPRRNRAIFS